MKKQVWRVSGLVLALMGILTLADAGQEKHGKGGTCDGKDGRPDREQMMKKYDHDGDGHLSDEELDRLRKDRAAARAEHGGKHPDREEIMRRFDQDGDGQLSEEERAALREEMGRHKGGRHGGFDGERPSREEMMKKFDADGDGRLNEEERIAMHEAFESRRREHEWQSEQEK